jgi:methylated-DNA-[protein]-cysteine S-methyltransferase
MLVRTAHVDSPIGPLGLAATDRGLCMLSFDATPRTLARAIAERFEEAEIAGDPSLDGAVEALRRYLDGDLRAIDRVRVDAGGTPFQQKVWTALRRIPVGTTMGYGELARRIDAPGAARAVGLANGRNPVAIVVPCHRVVAHNGTLHGYGGGLRRKEWLLQHEGALLATGTGKDA